MASFKETLINTSFLLTTDETKKTLDAKYKFLNNYIKGFNTFDKEKLLSEIRNVRAYKKRYFGKKSKKDNENKENNFNSRDYYFGDKKITLDDEQYSIVNSAPYNNIRIISCAGSGKSTTLLCRVKYL